MTTSCPLPPRLCRLVAACIKAQRTDDKAISRILGLTEATTHSYFQDALEAAGVDSRSALIMKAMDSGWYYSQID